MGAISDFLGGLMCDTHEITQEDGSIKTVITDPECEKTMKTYEKYAIIVGVVIVAILALKMVMKSKGGPRLGFA